MLKDSVFLQKIEIDEEKPKTTEEKAKQLEEYAKTILSKKRQHTYIKCLMGRNLVDIKKETGLKGKKFLNHVHKYLPNSYSKSEIHFMMNLHDLSLSFNKLMFVTLGTGMLKSNFKLVRQVMEADVVFWQHCPTSRNAAIK